MSLAVGGLIALAAGMGIGRFIYTPILPLMAEQLQLSASQAGLIASSNYLGYFAGALLPALGWLRGSARALLLAGLVVNVAGLLAMALTDSFSLHIVIRFAGGLASAFILVFSSAIILEKLGAIGRGDLTAVYFGGVGIGIALSAVAVTLMVAAGADWRGGWFAGAGLAVIACIAVFLLVPGRPTAPGAAGNTGRARVASTVRTLIIAYGLFGFGYIITATFIVAIVRETPEIRAAEPFIWAAVGLAGIPSIAFWMWVSRCAGVLRAFAIACLVEAAGVAASVLVPSMAGIIVAAAFLGGTFIGITALGFIAIRQLSDGDSRVDLARMTTSFSAGQVIGPVFAGAIADASGDYVLASLSAAAALTAAAMMVGLGPARRGLPPN